MSRLGCVPGRTIGPPLQMRGRRVGLLQIGHFRCSAHGNGKVTDNGYLSTGVEVDVITPEEPQEMRSKGLQYWEKVSADDIIGWNDGRPDTPLLVSVNES
jgi:hypothetical protein